MQYIVKLLGDMTAEPGCMVLQGLLLIAGSSGRPLPELVALQCVDAAVKHLLAKHGASARAESLPRYAHGFRLLSLPCVGSLGSFDAFTAISITLG